MIANLLIVEDDQYLRWDIKNLLSRFGNVLEASNIEQAQKIIQNHTLAIAFIDLNLNGQNDGLEVLKLAAKKNICSIVLTANDDKKIISKAYELGCHHYFSKINITESFDKDIAPYVNGILHKEIEESLLRQFITNDQKLISNFRFIIEQTRNQNHKILITGPTGVGKTKMAKIFHQAHNNSDENFIAINLSQVPENLIESTLFGHKKGAFTGASENQIGLLELANNGTLFIDEIGSISTLMQKKLLKVIEEKEFSPLGSNKKIKVQFRLITATCEDLGQLIEEGLFRTDFYFRIKGYEINIPPLKERRSDILALVDYFSKKSTRKIFFDDSALTLLYQYDWHGNIRELEHLIESLTKAKKGKIDSHDLPIYIQKNENPYSGQQIKNLYNSEIAKFIYNNGFRKLVSLLEKEAFLDFIKKNNGHITQTQEQLKISKSALYRIQNSIK